MKTRGQVAFEAYAEKAQELEVKLIAREWERLSSGAQASWEAAAEAVHNADHIQRREQFEIRLAAYVEQILNYDQSEDQSVWLHIRARELLWAMYPDLDNKGALALLQEMVKSVRAAQNDG